MIRGRAYRRTPQSRTPRSPVTLETEVGTVGPWCPTRPWIRMGGDSQGLDLRWRIAEVKDDGCVTPRSEVADDHGLSEVDVPTSPTDTQNVFLCRDPPSAFWTVADQLADQCRASIDGGQPPEPHHRVIQRYVIASSGSLGCGVSGVVW